MCVERIFRWDLLTSKPMKIVRQFHRSFSLIAEPLQCGVTLIRTDTALTSLHVCVLMYI